MGAPTATDAGLDAGLEVTVVVPMYNAAPTIGRCLDSIAAQTKTPARVIVVDDGSTDESTEVARTAAPTLQWLTR